MPEPFVPPVAVIVPPLIVTVPPSLLFPPPIPAPLVPPVAVTVPDAEPEENNEPAAETSDVPANASELFDTSPYAVAKTAAARKSAKSEQKTLSLDPVARGRFEKSEPTIVGGEDLDVPTFIRQKIKLR